MKQYLDIRIDDTLFELVGAWQLGQIGNIETKADLNSLRFSFGNQIVSEEVYLIHPDDVERVRRAMPGTSASENIDLEIKVISSTRDVHLLKISGSAEKYREDKTRETEVDLQQHFIAQIADTVPDMISVMDVKARKLTYLNRTSFRSDEVDRDQLLSKSYDDLRVLIHPDDGLLVDNYYATLKEASDEEIVEVDYRAVRENDDWQWFHARGKVFQRNNEGEVTHVLSVVQNITEKRRAQSEAKVKQDLLEATMNSSLDMIQVFKAIRGTNGEIVDFIWVLNNNASERIYGNVIGKSLIQTNPGVVEAGIFDTFKRVVETGVSDRSERHYVHEQFNGWFLQSTVKLDEGVVTTTTNITHLKNIEHQLEQSKEQLRATLDSSPYIIQAFEAIRNDKGKIVDFRWAFNNRFGIQQNGDVIGESLLKHNPGVMESGLFDQFIRVTDTGGSIDQEVFYNHEQFNAWFRQTLVKMGDGFVMNTEDITERKNSEKEIREKQALLESVLNNTESCIMFLAPVRDNEHEIYDFEYRYTNDQTLKSVQREVLIGKRMTQEFPELKDSALLKKYSTVCDSGEPFKGELDIQPYGYSVWAQVFVQKFVDGILVTYFDITERRKTEQQLIESKNLVQTVFDVSLHPIAYHKVVRDEMGNITDFTFQLENRQARKYSIEDRTGQRYSEAYPGIKDTIVFSKYCEVINTGNYLNEEVQLTLQGVEHWFHLMAVKLGDGLVATAVDITERKEAEKQIQQSKDLLESILNTLPKGLAVFEAVRDEKDQLINLRYLMRNGYKIEGNEVDHLKGRLQTEAHPGAVATGIHEKLKAVLQTGINADFEVHYEYEGVSEWLRVMATKFRDGVIAFTEEITERKKAHGEILQLQEEIAQNATDKYLALFKSIDEGLSVLELIYDDEGRPHDMRFVETNPALEKITGLNNAAGKLFSEFVPTEQHRLDAYDHVVKTGEPLLTEDYHEGMNKWYRTHTSRVGGSESRMVVSVIEDITTRKRREANLSFLASLMSDFAPLSSVDQIMNLAGMRLVKHLNLSHCFFVEVNQDAGECTVLYHLLPEQQQKITGTYNLAVFHSDEDNKVLSSGQSMIVNDVEDGKRSPEQAAAYKALNIAALINTPHIDKGRWVFEIGIGRSNPCIWLQDEIELMQEVSSRLWIRMERARIEEALRKSEEKYRTLFESIDEGFGIQEVVTDEHGKVTDVIYREGNGAFENLTGMKDVVGKKGSEFLPHLEESWLDALTQVYKTGKPLRAENYTADLDRWFTYYYSRIGDSGSPFIAVVFNDITERKQREQQQEYVLKLNDSLRPITNPIEVQRVATRVLGEHLNVDRVIYAEINIEEDWFEATDNYTSESVQKVIGRFPFAAFGPPGEKLKKGETLVIHNVNAEVSGAEERAAFFSINVHAVVAVPLIKQGSLVADLSVHQARPRRWRENEIALIQETAERTWAAVERAKAEEALRESEVQLKKLVKLRDEFIGIAGHELNTPITSLKVYGQIVQEKIEAWGDENIIHLVSRLNAQIDRLTVLIKTLLDTTRFAEGKLQLLSEEVDVKELIEERAEELSRISSHQVKLHLEEVPAIRADRERIGQVLTNLLSNAMKFSPKETTINIYLEHQNDVVKISVQDQGFGIPESDIPKVFERFFRVKANNMDSYPGMGLGLYISSQIVERHGGTMIVHSKEGIGSTFTFTLPIVNI